jgi:hypothetical protein
MHYDENEMLSRTQNGCSPDVGNQRPPKCLSTVVYHDAKGYDIHENQTEYGRTVYMNPAGPSARGRQNTLWAGKFYLLASPNVRHMLWVQNSWIGSPPTCHAASTWRHGNGQSVRSSFPRSWRCAICPQTKISWSISVMTEFAESVIWPGNIQRTKIYLVPLESSRKDDSNGIKNIFLGPNLAPLHSQTVSGQTILTL